MNGYNHEQLTYVSASADGQESCRPQTRKRGSRSRLGGNSFRATTTAPFDRNWTRGSLLAAGVPIALVLTGLLWQMIGIGNSIMEAQAVRFAADKTAYEAAVWHARGMNVIATLNLLMASLASVLVAWDHFKEIVATASSFCVVKGEICNFQEAEALRVKIEAATPAVNAWLEQQIRVIGNLERTTVTVTPTIAFEKSAVVTSDYVSYATQYGASLVPDTRVAAVMGSTPATGRWGLGADLPALPIQAETEENFCWNAEPWVPEAAVKLLEGLQSPWVIPVLVKHKVDYKKAWSLAGRQWKCLHTSGNAAGIWDAAKSGNPDHLVAFQIFGFSFGRPDIHDRDDKNVSILVGDGNPASTAKTAWTASQAEFFFPCNVPWKACAATSLFDPAWRARLKRVRSPKGAGNGILANLASNLNAAAPGPAQTILGSGAVWSRVGKLVH